MQWHNSPLLRHLQLGIPWLRGESNGNHGRTKHHNAVCHLNTKLARYCWRFLGRNVYHAGRDTSDCFRLTRPVFHLDVIIPLAVTSRSICFLIDSWGEIVQGSHLAQTPKTSGSHSPLVYSLSYNGYFPHQGFTFDPRERAIYQNYTIVKDFVVIGRPTEIYPQVYFLKSIGQHDV